MQVSMLERVGRVGCGRHHKNQKKKTLHHGGGAASQEDGRDQSCMPRAQDGCPFSIAKARTLSRRIPVLVSKSSTVAGP